MSKIQQFLDRASEVLGPGCVCIHNRTGEPMLFWHDKRRIAVAEFRLVNGEAGTGCKPDKSWDTFERNLDALVKYRDKLLRVCEENSVVPGTIVFTARVVKERFRDDKGNPKRQDVFHCGMWVPCALQRKLEHQGENDRED